MRFRKTVTKKAEEDLVLPFIKGEKGVEACFSAFHYTAVPIALGDFEAKEGELLVLYPEKGPKRILLVGLGEGSALSADRLRLAYYKAARLCREKKWMTLTVVPPQLPVEGSERAVCEAFLLAEYQWPHAKTAEMFSLHVHELSAQGWKAVKQWETITEGVFLARDLVNESAHTMTPVRLAEEAQRLEQQSEGKLKATIFDLKAIKRHKMGLLEAVAAGSAVEPRFIMLAYRGAPKSQEHTVLIGKGVTYDTGGLNLKPTGSMETMKGDMAGSATVLATVATAAALHLPCNVTAVVPATENAIDGRSYKPGDVFTAYDGTTVEIGNTDAEGRLILADAIGYTLEHLAPTRMIDWATLTGAVVVALGDGLAGLFTEDRALEQALQAAGDRVGEPLWPLPLYALYEDKLKSKIADINNVGGRAGGAILGALFLKRFVTRPVSWAHIDFAGPAFLEKEFREWPLHGVGFGVRLLIEFLSQSK